MDVSALTTLVDAATDGMRKTQSADEIQDEDPAAQPQQPKDGHQSDSAVPPTRERKKGVPWTEEEHRLFLLGLQKLGKGDWRGISRHFVQSRTPTQVASHAQKYFIRQNNLNKRKRRSSLFDIVSEPPASTASAEAAVAVGNLASAGKDVKVPHTSAAGPSGRPAAQAGAAQAQVPGPGGLSLAFASAHMPGVVPHLGGFNPTSGIPPPASLSMHAAMPPNTTAAGASSKTDPSMGDAANATIAALSLAASPAASAGYAAAAAAAAAASGHGGAVASSAPAYAHAVPQSPFAAHTPPGDPFAAMMTSIGQMGASYPGPAATNWIAHYHQFLQQMSAAAAQQQPPQQVPQHNPYQQPGAPVGSIMPALIKPTALHAVHATHAAAPAAPGA